MSQFGWRHWPAVKSILRYLHSIKAKFLCSGKLDLNLQGNCDSDIDSNVGIQKSSGGYILRLAGGAISWSTQLQLIVAVFTGVNAYVPSLL